MLKRILNKTTNHIYVIAEIGINHNGSLTTALELINYAHEAGVDAVKFQKEILIIFTTKKSLMTQIVVNGISSI